MRNISAVKVANECSNMAYSMRVAITSIERADGYKSLPLSARQYLASAMKTLEFAAGKADDLSNEAGEVVIEALEAGKCRLRPTGVERDVTTDHVANTVNVRSGK